MSRTTLMVAAALGAGLVALQGVRHRLAGEPDQAASPTSTVRVPAVLVDTSGVTTRRVLADKSISGLASPSPDGREIAYYEPESGDIIVRTLATGRTLNLTHNQKPYYPGMGIFPLYSPDGTRIAYAWQNVLRGTWQIRISPAEGGAARVIDDGGTTTVDLAIMDWSPDGRSIVGMRERPDGTNQIILVPVNGGAVRVLKSLDWRVPTDMYFSRDGRWIYYDLPASQTSIQRDIYALAVDGSRETHLLSEPSNDRVAGVTPDGRALLFLSDRGGTPGAWLLPVEGGGVAGQPTLVKSDLWGAEPITLMRDGEFLYAVDVGDESVYTASFDAGVGSFGRPTRVGTSGPNRRLHPTWSPDGHFLAYSTHPLIGTGLARVRIRSMESGAVRELPPIPDITYLTRLRWTADGRSLLVLGYDRKRRVALYRLDAQTGASQRLLVLPPGEGIGALLPMGGDSLLCLRFRSVRGDSVHHDWFAILQVDSGRERRVYSLRPGEGLNGLTVSLSPAAHQVAFAMSDLSKGVGGWTQNELRIVDLRNGTARTLSAPATTWIASTVWQDPGTILVASREGKPDSDRYRVVRVHLDTGEFEPLGLAMTGLRSLRLAPSSDRIAFVGGEQKREIWAMSGFLHDGRSTPGKERP